MMEIKDLGRMEYAEALAMQERLREQRIRDEIQDTVLLLEHPPVYTIGKDLVEESRLIRTEGGKQSPLPAPIFRVNRGGKITYHGPGQLVGYFIFKIPQAEIGNFVDAVENLTLALSREQGIQAYSRKQETDAFGKNIRGAWCSLDGEHRKIAAQGIETKLALSPNKANHQEAKYPEAKYLVTMHGFALNITTNLDHFQPINACGFTYQVMTSMQAVLGSEKVNFEAVKRSCEEKILSFFTRFCPLSSSSSSMRDEHP